MYESGEYLAVLVLVCPSCRALGLFWLFWQFWPVSYKRELALLRLLVPRRPLCLLLESRTMLWASLLGGPRFASRSPARSLARAMMTPGWGAMPESGLTQARHLHA